jgi:hypothetical protein
MAAAISMLRGGMDPDAICDAAWCRERLNIPKDEDPLKQDEIPAKIPPDQTQLPFNQSGQNLSDKIPNGV